MLVNYFAVLVVLLLISGLAIDGGVLEWRRLHLQFAADAAAQQAMYQFGRNDAGYATEGKNQASANGFTDGVDGATVSVVNPPSLTAWTGDPWSVEATVSQTVPNVFMGLIGAGKSTLSATAVARVLPTCVWIMNPTETGGGAAMWLASATLSGPCGAYVNTSAGNSLEVDGFSSLVNLRTRVVGLASSNLSTGNVIPAARFSSSQKRDPLAYITSPAFSSCTISGVTITTGSHSIGPGTYCGGLSISNSTVTMSPGLYIITGGLTVSGSIVDGTSGVTLFFTQGGGSGFGTVNVNNSTLKLKAPTSSFSGGVAGISVFGDRNWITHGTQGVRITFTQIQDDGIWYLLNTGLYMWQSPFTFYSYNGWVVDNLYYFGATATFHTDYSSLGGYLSSTPYHYEDGALVE